MKKLYPESMHGVDVKSISCFKTVLQIALFISCGAHSAASETETIGDFQWTYSIDTERSHAEIEKMHYVGNLSGSTIDINVPSCLGGFPVVSLDYAYAYYEGTREEGYYFDCGTLFLPSTIRDFDISWFGTGCWPSIEKIVVDVDNPWYSSMDGVLYDKNQRILVFCPEGITGTLTVPKSVEIIRSNGIGLTHISRIRIPANVRLIGDTGNGDAFFYNQLLSEIEVDPNNDYYSTYDGCLYDKNQTAFLYFPQGRQIYAPEGEVPVVSLKDGVKYYDGPGLWMCPYEQIFIPDSVIHFSSVIDPIWSGIKAISFPGRFESQVEWFEYSDVIPHFRSIASDDLGIKPENDLFCKAERLTGASGYVLGFTGNGSIENNEHNLAPTATSSVWYSWTAPKTGTVTLCMRNAFSSSRYGQYETLTNYLSVVSGGSLSDMEIVCSTNVTWTRQSQQVPRTTLCQFFATVDETYSIAVSDDPDRRQGTPLFRLEWEYLQLNDEMPESASVPIPAMWLDDNAASILASNGGDYEEAAKATAANGVNKVWECYVAGISPTNAAARFEARIEFDADGKPVVTWTPDLNEGGKKEERVYVVEGQERLGDGWGPTNAASRFFRVKVAMPEE